MDECWPMDKPSCPPYLGEMHDARLFLEAQMNAVEAFPLAGGTVAVFSTRNPAKASANEDAAGIFALDGDTTVLAVADGMGGGPAGEHASGLAVSSLQNALANGLAAGERLRSAILDGIDTANRKIQATFPEAATTLALVEIHKGKLRPYHIGDSVILAFSTRGRLKLQTVMHSPVGYAIEAGVLNQADAMHHQQRHVVSNMVGCANMRIEIGSPIKLSLRDTVLLASDGLFDNLHIEEIVATLRKCDLVEGVASLVRESLERMTKPSPAMPSKPDDLTIVAYRPAAAPRSQEEHIGPSATPETAENGNA